MQRQQLLWALRIALTIVGRQRYLGAATTMRNDNMIAFLVYTSEFGVAAFMNDVEIIILLEAISI